VKIWKLQFVVLHCTPIGPHKRENKEAFIVVVVVVIYVILSLMS